MPEKSSSVPLNKLEVILQVKVAHRNIALYRLLMSKKYYERVLKGTGVQSSKFHSKFGAAVLAKFGWKEGEGLGKESTGITDCIQIQRREQSLGLGANTTATKSENEWTNWWDHLYDSTAVKVRQETSDLQGDSTDSSSSTESIEDPKQYSSSLTRKSSSKLVDTNLASNMDITLDLPKKKVVIVGKIKDRKHSSSILDQENGVNKKVKKHIKKVKNAELSKKELKRSKRSPSSVTNEVDALISKKRKKLK